MCAQCGCELPKDEEQSSQTREDREANGAFEFDPPVTAGENSVVEEAS
ncbi:MAG: hypothetical protein ACRDKS_12340 [Actinomycetota bacterium]